MLQLDPDEKSFSEREFQKTNSQFVHEYEDTSRLVEDIFNSIDPLDAIKNNTGTYTSSAARFMDQLDNQQLTKLTRDEIETMVRNSFQEDQISVVPSEDKNEKLVDYIDSIKNQ